MKYGIDFLGGARYQKTVLAEQPRAYGFGGFLEVDGFGAMYDLIKGLDAFGLPFIRAHVMWKDDHNFSQGDVKIVETRAKKLASLKLKTKLYVSPCCENRLDAGKFEPFANAVRKHLPSAIIVNCPVKGSGHRSNKYLNEFHGSDPRAKAGDGFSFDGENIVDSDVEKYKAKGFEYFMIWNSQCNGRRNLEDKTPRKDRKFWPTSKQIDSWVYLTTHSKGATKIPRDWIFKSHSDQHTVPPSGKDQKPVWVKLPKFKAIEVKARNGALIDKAPYFGTFAGGGHRYYHSDWGYALTDKAIRIQGDGLCDVFADGKKVGQITLAFRDGSYR